MANSDSTTTFVYFISAGAAPIKIGVANDPASRMRELQTAHYQQLHLLYTIECPSREHAFEIESAFHRWYGECRIRNEWFNVTPQEIGDDVRLLMSLSKGITITQHTSQDVITKLEARAHKRIVEKNTNARQAILDHLSASPDLADMPVRELAEVVGVGKSTVAEVLREWRSSNDR